MKINLNISPVKVLKNDSAKMYFSHDESQHWIDVIEANHGYDAAERIHVILIELLENAVFHNTDDESDIAYEIEINGHVGFIRVINMVTDEQKTMLSEKIKKYAKSNNLDQEYAEAMSLSDEGGLGLLRLMTEQQCKLRMYEKGSSYIQIEARIEL